MTNEEIKNLTDEQLNQAVHKTMDKCWHEIEWQEKPAGYKCGKCGRVLLISKITDEQDFETNSDYCNDMSQAILVLDYVLGNTSYNDQSIRRDYYPTLGADDCGQWCVELAVDGLIEGMVIAVNPNPARAICEAFLMVMKGNR